jgi:AraC family transcriptional regulator
MCVVSVGDGMSVEATAQQVYQASGVEEQKSGGRSAHEFPPGETHGIALWPGHRLLAHSQGLGWHDIYLSLATEKPWTHTLAPAQHWCVAYCLHRPARIERQIDGEAQRQSAELRPRLLGLIPADRGSRWSVRGSPDILLIYLRRAMVDALIHEVHGNDASGVELLPRLGFADAMLEQLALGALDAARDGALRDANGLYADSVARLMALHLLRHHATRWPSAEPGVPELRSARLRHVRELIESALDEDLSVERLAREAGVSAHAFAAAFTRAFGVPPHRHVLARRIERAKQMLRGGDQPVAAIARHCGFASQSHLASVFKRAVGTTPAAYRRDGRSAH